MNEKQKGTKMDWNRGIFTVAEIGANHLHNFDRIKNLITSAKNCGADAVKLQVFDADMMADPNGRPLKDTIWKGKALYQIYKESELGSENIEKAFDFAKSISITIFCSVYYPQIVEFTERLDNPVYKISSFELTYDGLIETVAKTGKPIILSTGSADLPEIYNAVKTIRRYHNNFALLHCVSKYPASESEMNLHTILDMRKRFKCPIGLSDHTRGILCPIIAATLGARIIEKHFNIDNQGLDAEFSILPAQFRIMVDSVKKTAEALGKVNYGGIKRFRRKYINGKYLRSAD